MGKEESDERGVSISCYVRNRHHVSQCQEEQESGMIASEVSEDEEKRERE